ncbi:MAG: putative drug exporter of the superfamily [Solirubrobacteraceae bacterium]|jgi:RND superfamily putative drug exporter|nr:putative drug exporter of the superfamily [Solirubrobacteraceae bacterium]
MRRAAQWSHDRHKLVVGIWIAAIVALSAIAAGAGGGFSDNFSLPASESQKAIDLLRSKFPAQAGDSSRIVFKANSGTLADAIHRAEVLSVVTKVRTLPSVAGVADPFATPGSVSRDGTIGFATLAFDQQANKLDKAQVQRVIDTARSGANAGLQVNLGGQAIKLAERPAQSATEAIGVLVAIVVLLVVLGSFAAMSMPLIVTFASLAVAMTAVLAISSVVDIASFAPTLAVMIALGVGIDYALLIISRFRGERRRGEEVRAATVNALDTAGRSVLFAGTTVVIGLLGMLLLGISFLNGPAMAAALAVFCTMVGSLTLLPALLGWFGHRVKLGAAPNPDKPTRWARWAARLERRPRVFALATVAVLVVVALPVTGMTLGSADAGNDAPGSTTRLAYDQLSEGFGPGFNGPLVVVSELPAKGDTAALARLSGALSAERGVAAVSKPVLNPAGDTATMAVFPTTKPQDQATTDLLSRLRGHVVPAVERHTSIQASIGGAAALTTDLDSALSSKLPLFVAVVVGLSLLLLAVVFRSLVIPVKAAFMNVLSIGASLGVITWVFQEGHLTSLIGIDTTGPIEAFLPVFLFAIVFGLSMDYEVFLVTRMHEEWERRKDAAAAVRNGLALTGKVVMAAAIIMISVFGSFMFGGDRTIKLFGLGLASAVLFDAFVIRLILVPSLMYLFGRWSWWMPDRIARRLPRLSIEGPAQPAPETT